MKDTQNLFDFSFYKMEERKFQLAKINGLPVRLKTKPSDN